MISSAAVPAMFADQIKGLLIKLAFAAAVFAAGWFVGSWFAGISYNEQIQTMTAQHERAKAEWSAKDAAAARQQAAALAATVDKLQRAEAASQKATAAQQATERELSAVKAQLKQRISHATKTDGANYSGLGPHGLQLYAAALGYPVDSRCLPANPGSIATDANQAGRACAGLSPDDILAHATDYGQYCRSLERQLEGVRAWELSK